MAQLKDLAELKSQGHPHRRRIRGPEGEDPGVLSAEPAVGPVCSTWPCRRHGCPSARLCRTFPAIGERGHNGADMTLSTAWHVPVAGFVVTDIWLSGSAGSPPRRKGRMSAESDNAVTAGGDASPRLAVLLVAAMFVLVVDMSFMNVSISRRRGSGHHGDALAVGDRAEAFVSAPFIPHQLEDVRSHRPPARLRDRPAGRCDWCAGDDPDPDLTTASSSGHHRRARSLSPLASHAITHPRQLHRGAEEDLRARRSLRGDRGGDRPAPGWVRHHLPVLAVGSALRSSSSSSCCPRSASSRTSRTPEAANRCCGCHPFHRRYGGIVLGILVWQEGGGYVGLIIAIGAVLGRFATGSCSASVAGSQLSSTRSVQTLNFRIGVSRQMLQQITLGGAMIALPLYLQMALEYNAMEAGLSLAPLSLSMFGVALLADRRAATVAQPISCWSVSLCAPSVSPPSSPSSREWTRVILVIPLLFAGSGLGLLVSQLNNFTLAPIAEERVSEAAGEFGRRLVRPVFWPGGGRGLLLWVLAMSFTNDLFEQRDSLGPAAADRRLHRDRRRDHGRHAAAAARSGPEVAGIRMRSSPSTPRLRIAPSSSPSSSRLWQVFELADTSKFATFLT